MDWALWVAVAVLLIYGALAISQDMASRGVGGRGGWRYGVLFPFFPCFMIFVWLVERRRFPKLDEQPVEERV